MLTIAEPAFVDAFPAQGGEIIERLAARRKVFIQKRLQIAVKTPPGDTGGYCSDSVGLSLLTTHHSTLMPQV